MPREHRQSQYFSHLLSFNQRVFAPLIVLAFGTLMLDMMSFPGFLQKSIGIAPSVFLVLGATSYIVLILQRLLFNESLNEETSLILRANFVMFPFVILVYNMLIQLERSNYPNYVFSTFRLHLPIFGQVVAFSFFLTAFYLWSFLLNVRIPFMVKVTRQGKVQYQLNKKQLIPLVFAASVVILAGTQLWSISEIMLNDLTDIARRPFASFAERKVEKFGGPYRTYEFIKRHTEPDSIIAVPPQFTWGIIGNIGFSRYFLYPRFLIHPEDYTTETMPEVDYYVIGETISNYDEANTYKIWPSEGFAVDEIYVFNELANVEEKLSTQYYDPQDPVHVGKWGLIKTLPGTKVHSVNP